MRSQEILSRLDAAFQLISSNGITERIFDNIYSDSSTSTSSEQQQQLHISQSLTNSQIKYYLNNIPTIKNNTTTLTNLSNVKLQFTQIILVELFTVFNENIFISTIGTKFIVLSIKILNQYERFILSMIENKFSSFIEMNDLMCLLEDVLYVSMWIQQIFIPFIEERFLSKYHIIINLLLFNLLNF